MMAVHKGTGGDTEHRSRSGPAPYPPVLDHRGYQAAAQALVVILIGMAIYLALNQRWFDAAASAGLALVGGAFLAVRDRLPALFSMLFLLAATINLAGYIFSLWKDPLWFDEMVHAATSFAVMAAIGWLLLARRWIEGAGHTGWFMLAVGAIGIGVGIAWELFEWAIGIIGDRRDTIIDLVMDMIGAVLAALFCAWAVGMTRTSATEAADQSGRR